MAANYSDYPPTLRNIMRKFDKEIVELFHTLRYGGLTLTQWREATQRVIAKYIPAAMMAGAKTPDLLPEQLLAVENRLGVQLGYFNNFADAIEHGIALQDEVVIAPGPAPTAATTGQPQKQTPWQQYEVRLKRYVTSVVAPYWIGATGALPLPAIPGDGTTQCGQSCKCAWEIRPVDPKKGDFDCYWKTRPAEHCQTCIVRARDWNPLKVRDWQLVLTGAVTFTELKADFSETLKGGPGSGHYGHAGRPGKHGGSAPGTSSDRVEHSALSKVVVNNKDEELVASVKMRVASSLDRVDRDNPGTRGILMPDGKVVYDPTARMYHTQTFAALVLKTPDKDLFGSKDETIARKARAREIIKNKILEDTDFEEAAMVALGGALSIEWPRANPMSSNPVEKRQRYLDVKTTWNADVSEMRQLFQRLRRMLERGQIPETEFIGLSIVGGGATGNYDMAEFLEMAGIRKALGSRSERGIDTWEAIFKESRPVTEREVSRILRASLKHYSGEHDQKTHGNWASGTKRYGKFHYKVAQDLSQVPFIDVDSISGPKTFDPDAVVTRAILLPDDRVIYGTMHDYHTPMFSAALLTEPIDERSMTKDERDNLRFMRLDAEDILDKRILEDTDMEEYAKKTIGAVSVESFMSNSYSGPSSLGLSFEGLWDAEVGDTRQLFQRVLRMVKKGWINTRNAPGGVRIIGSNARGWFSLDDLENMSGIRIAAATTPGFLEWEPIFKERRTLKHMAGKHDQKTHGNWASGKRPDSRSAQTIEDDRLLVRGSLRLKTAQDFSSVPLRKSGVFDDPEREGTVMRAILMSDGRVIYGTIHDYHTPIYAALLLTEPIDERNMTRDDRARLKEYRESARDILRYRMDEDTDTEEYAKEIFGAVSVESTFDSTNPRARGRNIRFEGRWNGSEGETKQLFQRVLRYVKKGWISSSNAGDGVMIAGSGARGNFALDDLEAMAGIRKIQSSLFYYWEPIFKERRTTVKGGPGSGHWGHAGVPGHHGGSAPGTRAQIASGREKPLHKLAQETFVTDPSSRDVPYPEVVQRIMDDYSARISKAKNATQARKLFMKGVRELDAAYSKEVPRLAKLKEQANQKFLAVVDSKDANDEELKRATDEAEKALSEYAAAYKTFGVAKVDMLLNGIRAKNTAPYKASIYVSPSIPQGWHEGLKGYAQEVFDLVPAEIVSTKGKNPYENATPYYSPELWIGLEQNYDSSGHYDPKNDTIFIGAVVGMDSNRRLVSHEVGHWLSARIPGALARAHDMYLKRTDGEPLLRKRNDSSLLEPVMYRRDKFFDPYMGKTYSVPRRKPTSIEDGCEILTVGLEKMLSHPYELAKKDPQSFELVMSVFFNYPEIARTKETRDISRIIKTTLKGGRGSGHFGHRGVRGQHGGSAPSDFGPRTMSNDRFYRESPFKRRWVFEEAIRDYIPSAIGGYILRGEDPDIRKLADVVYQAADDADERLERFDKGEKLEVSGLKPWVKRNEVDDWRKAYRDAELTREEVEWIRNYTRKLKDERLSYVHKALRLPDTVGELFAELDIDPKTDPWDRNDPDASRARRRKLEAFARERITPELVLNHNFSKKEVDWEVFYAYREELARKYGRPADDRKALSGEDEQSLAERWVYDIGRSMEQPYAFEVQHQISLGKIDPARDPNYRSEQEAWQPLPETLYHVTTNAKAVLADRIRSRRELAVSAMGLGGGDDHTISFTGDPDVANMIERALHEAHMVANGKFTATMMLERAKQGKGGNIGRDWSGLLTDNHEFRDLLRYERGEEVRDYKNRQWDNDKYLDSLWSFWHIPYVGARKQAGGLDDPLFFCTDWRGLAKLNPKEFKCLKVKPIKGARGWRVSSLGEWRTVGGDTVKITDIIDDFGGDDEYSVDHILGR